MKKPKMSLLSAILLLALISATVVLGAVLYTLTLPATWRVQLAYGLTLFKEDRKLW